MYIIVPLQKANCKKRLNTKVDATSEPAVQSTSTSALFVCRVLAKILRLVNNGTLFSLFYLPNSNMTRFQLMVSLPSQKPLNFKVAIE